MAIVRPKTFVEWYFAVRAAKLTVGPFEGIRGDLVNHALGRIDKKSYGFWDHNGNLGHFDPDKTFEPEIAPAPPVNPDDPEWR
jgi:hypothetical protein